MTLRHTEIEELVMTVRHTEIEALKLSHRYPVAGRSFQ